MAITAEAPQFDQTQDFIDIPYPMLTLVEEPATVPETYFEPPPSLVDLDTIPELTHVRRSAKKDAERILEENRQLVIGGNFESVPIPVDPLGTARHVVEIRKKFGKDSSEYKQAFAGLALDSERLEIEAVRKGTWEKFGKSFQPLDPKTNLYHSHDIPILHVNERGLSPIISEPEELDRRINDYTAERTNHVIPHVRAMGHLALHETVTVRGIWECTDWAIEAYKTNKKASHGGYVPEIEKFMIVDLLFDESGNREQEQVALPGIYITHEVINTVLEQQGAIAEGKMLTKTELQGKQFIDKDNTGIINFIQQLDQLASEVSGKNIYMGEAVPEGFEKNYSNIDSEAEERRQKLAPKPVLLANYLIDLVDNNTDKWAAEALVQEFLKDMMLEIAIKNPDQAAIIFDQPTADGLKEVARLEANGLSGDADILLARVVENLPEVTYCGAGMCGLDKVDPNSHEAKVAQALGLKDDLLHDTERKCPNCEAKSIYYDGVGNKACIGCGYSEIDGITNMDLSEK